jgi:hypothetical protein
MRGICRNNPKRCRDGEKYGEAKYFTGELRDGVK